MWREAEMSENERILQVKSKLEVLGREPKTVTATVSWKCSAQ